MNHYSSALLRICTSNRTLIVLWIFVIGISLYQYVYSEQLENNHLPIPSAGDCGDSYIVHRYVVEKFYENRKNWITSNLGSIMFKNIAPEVFVHSSRQQKTYTILIWKYYDWLKKRHIEGFNKPVNNYNEDPLAGCSVANCIFSGDDDYLNTADAVVVHIQKGLFPYVEKRNTSQRWVFLSDESPINTFSMAQNKTISFQSLENVFNWSMTYRCDSDVPVPYGRTLPLLTPLIPCDVEDQNEAIAHLVPNWNIKWTDSLAILVSNCGVKQRKNFLIEIQKYIKVDVYGGCASNPEFKRSCPGHFRADCEVLSPYLFYLALENSFCRHYLTEKIFNNAYAKGAIPVIMGPSLEDCENLLPPNSYIHVDNFKSIEDLANYIKTISSDHNSLLSYHRWRNNFEIVSEHGYFGLKSNHYCRLCEALNYNDGELSVYDEDRLRLFLDQNVTCST